MAAFGSCRTISRLRVPHRHREHIERDRTDIARGERVQRERDRHPDEQRARGGHQRPVGETRFVRNEVILDIPANVATATLDALAARHTMSRIESTTIALTGRTLHRWRLDGGGTPAAMIGSVCSSEPSGLVAGGQVNFLYALAQQEAAPVNAEQYAPQKLALPEAHRLATGNRVPIAVIDSEVDASHPDLAGAITSPQL